MRLDPQERDFMERVVSGRPLKSADRAEDRVRQRLRRFGLVAVVQNPRRWIITEAGLSALQKKDSET